MTSDGVCNSRLFTLASARLLAITRQTRRLLRQLVFDVWSYQRLNKSKQTFSPYKNSPKRRLQIENPSEEWNINAVKCIRERVAFSVTSEGDSCTKPPWFHKLVQSRRKSDWFYNRPYLKPGWRVCVTATIHFCRSRGCSVIRHDSFVY